MTISGYGQHVSVMTYNIRLNTNADGPNAWPLRKQKVFTLLEKYNPDILGVQEALHDQLQDLLTNLPAYAHVGVGRDDGKEKGEYSAILYNREKFDAEESGTFWLSETPEIAGSKSWDAAITRVASWAKLFDKTNKRAFLVVNTHFDHIGQEARRKSAELIKERVKKLAGNLPVIITGDFNCTRDDAPYKVMMNQNHINLSDASTSSPGTFCGFEVGKMECKAIDYIFYTSPWKASNFNVISDNDGKYYPSDHLPVTVELTLQK